MAPLKLTQPNCCHFCVTSFGHVITKLWSSLYNKARRHLDKKSLLSLCYSYIYPYLTYCIEVWGCAAKSHLQSLFLLQKKIVRIIIIIIINSLLQTNVHIHVKKKKIYIYIYKYT